MLHVATLIIHQTAFEWLETMAHLVSELKLSNFKKSGLFVLKLSPGWIFNDPG